MSLDMLEELRAIDLADAEREGNGQQKCDRCERPGVILLDRSWLCKIHLDQALDELIREVWR